MKPIIGALIAGGLGFGFGIGGTAVAQELELKPPHLSTGSTCSPSLQARCTTITQPGLDHDLACDRCEPKVMPSDIINSSEQFSSPNRLSAPGRSSMPSRSSTGGTSSPRRDDGTQAAECALGQMPLGPTLPGCAPPPVDHIPQP